MNLLIVEDDEALRGQYRWSNLAQKFDLLYAGDRTSALTQINEYAPEIILLDLGLPPDPDNASEGLALLSDIMSAAYHAKVVVLTGSEQHAHALEAIRLGACDFQQKGISMEELEIALNRAATLHRLEKENRELRAASEPNQNLLGNSAAMQLAVKTLQRCAPIPISILLSGESGVGKELFAKTIHNLSGRVGEFVAINCASIPKELLESELFGHEKGAFTGASRRKIGKVELAHNGTLFLDEIGDMPLELQSNMLRFLQEREIERVGGDKPIPVNVRVICATHRKLDEMKESGTFREDLYFRLAEFVLNIPALREREDDVVLLANQCLAAYRKDMQMENSRTAQDFSKDAIAAMLSYNWPGNVRELQNLIKGALIMCENELISAADLRLSHVKPAIHFTHSLSVTADCPLVTLADAKAEAEKRAIQQAYQEADGNIALATRMLAISRPTFYALARRHQLALGGEEN